MLTGVCGTRNCAGKPSPAEHHEVDRCSPEVPLSLSLSEPMSFRQRQVTTTELKVSTEAQRHRTSALQVHCYAGAFAGAQIGVSRKRATTPQFVVNRNSTPC
jgi:hypothetical protein